jgi:hypothetical protein
MNQRRITTKLRGAPLAALPCSGGFGGILQSRRKGENMNKPTPKRLGLLRWIRDYSNDETGVPCYTSFLIVDYNRLGQYYLSDEDNRVLLAAHRAGLVRFREDQECFSFLTDEGKRVLEKYKNLYPQIPSKHFGQRPELP